MHCGDNPRPVDVGERMEVIRRLCSFERRRAGTDAERRAANYLAGRVREGGRRVEIDPTYVHPHYPLVHAVHCLLAIAGSLASLEIPALGFALVLLAAVSMYLDLNTRFYLVRRLFFRRASQNVVSRGRRPDAPARLILCAHYDAAQTGRAFHARTVERAARLQSHLPFPIGPFRIVFWSLAALLPVLGARMAGVDAEWLSIVQLLPTLILIIAVFLLVDIALSGVVPGANDNASGVATALALARELDRDPPERLDVWVLLTGAEWSLQEGMRSFLRARRDQLPRDSTYFLCLDTVGLGDVRFETAAGWAVSFPMDRRLVQLCEAIAEADRAGDHGYRARALRHAGLPGDSVAARVRRYAATTITCADELDVVPGVHTAADVPERIDAAALERAHGFALELVRQLDRDVGRRSALV
jgi:Peptidase family M28